MDDNQKDVVFIDAYNLIHRAFHGNPGNLTNKDGLPTNALYTTACMLMKIPAMFSNLTYAVAVFDGGTNFRTELDENYKANRKEMDEKLKLQMPYMRKMFQLLGFPIMESDNVEADDVIGTLAKRAAAKGFNTYILSCDKDFRQIITENLHVIDTMSDTQYDPAMVMEKMGVSVDNVVAYLALLGDSSDNVIGVEKIGKKTAAKLLTEYDNIEGIIKVKDQLTGVAGKNLAAAIDNGQIAKNIELITLKTDLDIHITTKDVRMKERDLPGWTAFCEEMNFQSFLRHKPKVS